MKNYYYNDTEDSKIFIINYEIKDNQIIVNTGDGKKYSIPYTKENEENILSKMREQLIYIPSHKEDITKDINEKKRILKLLLCGALLVSVTFIIAFPTLLPIIIGANVIEFAYAFAILKEQTDLLKDYEKHEFFLKNEVKLNNIDENNPNSLLNVSEKTKEIISTVPNEKPKFTLNTIHKMKYQDLKEILENIEIIETLGYNTTNIEDNNSDIKSWQKTNSK